MNQNKLVTFPFQLLPFLLNLNNPYYVHKQVEGNEEVEESREYNELPSKPRTLEHTPVFVQSIGQANHGTLGFFCESSHMSAKGFFKEASRVTQHDHHYPE